MYEPEEYRGNTHRFRVVAVKLLLHLCDGQASEHIGPAAIGSILVARLKSSRHAIDVDAQSEGYPHAFNTVAGNIRQGIGNRDRRGGK